MSNNNRGQEKRIDMSARSNMRIIAADQYETEQNQKSFGELNKAIDSKIQEYNEKLNHYIERSLKKTELDDEQSVNMADYQEKSFVYQYSTVNMHHRVKRHTISGAVAFFGIMIFILFSSFVYDIPEGIYGLPEEFVEVPVEDVPMANMSDISSGTSEESIDITTLYFLSDFQETVPTSYEYEEKNNYSMNTSKEIIAVDTVTGKKYFKGQLSGLTLLVPYVEGDKEVYFLGQYNENCRWDGYCVTNTYNLDGTLYGIYEYNFKDGKCLSCKSFYKSETKGNWIYLDREYNGSERYGKSIRYLFSDDVLKKFTNMDADTSDMLYADEFIKDSGAAMLTYYYGNMSDGKYNDGSGDAYEIIFDEDGFVRILYIAEFLHGKVNDTDAKEIVLDQSVKDYNYFYYNGPIKNNKRQGKVSGKDYVTQEQINDILKDSGFECDLDLKWHQENINNS